MNTIEERIRQLKQTIPAGITLVAVSKNQPPPVVMEAYQTGHRVFGENKAQELTAKAPNLPEDIEWHFIGHLQTNKVKSIIPVVSMIHSVDSPRLLKEIVKVARKQNREVDCLLQFHIAREESKYGLTIESAHQMLQALTTDDLQPVTIRGVMGMATFTDDAEQIASEFELLKKIFYELKERHFQQNPAFDQHSTAMSDDYTIAIGKGSTMVRIGSVIFG